MSRVTEILASKGTAVHTVDKGSTVLEAIQKMVETNVGALIVTEREEILGIFTERDYLRRIVLHGRASHTTRVEEVMTTELVCVEPGREVEDCMAIMTQQRVRHLPVMEGPRLVGILSIGDLVKHLSSEKEAQIRYLTDYIKGKYPG